MRLPLTGTDRLCNDARHGQLADGLEDPGRPSNASDTELVRTLSPWMPFTRGQQHFPVPPDIEMEP